MLGECAVRSLNRHSGSRLEGGDGATLVAQPLDRHSEVRRLREGGEGVGVRVPPELLREEPPLKELTARDGKAVEATARTDDRVHTRRLFADCGNPQLVAEAPDDR